MKYTHIISSDVNGTLIHKGRPLSPENSEAIYEFERRGICFALNTGRTVSEVPAGLLAHPAIRYYICADGSVIWDKKENIRTEITMSKEEFAPVFDLLQAYGTVDALCSGGHSYTDKATYTREIYAKKRVSELYALFIDYYASKIDNFATFVRNLDSVEMVCSFFENDEDMLECTKKIEAMGHFKIASSEPTNIEIYHKNAGKGNSLLRLADMLGVPYENTIAVGDSKNDMDMIQKAGLSLAMSNACYELKEAADRTICSCKEHSADFILKNYFS